MEEPDNAGGVPWYLQHNYTKSKSMKATTSILSIAILMMISGCSKDASSPKGSGSYDDGAYLDSGFGSGSGSGSGNQGNGQSDTSGLITAGEWNDLDHWDFWKNLFEKPEFSDKPAYWSFFTNNRVSVLVTKNNHPVYDGKVELKKNGNTVWTAKTDNLGKAELWIGLSQEDNSVNLSKYDLFVNDQEISASLKFFEYGINKIQISSGSTSSKRVDISFIVDATGSMGDELEFLKEDLKDVIQQVESNNTALDIRTSSVFYRDVSDDYVVKHSEFTGDFNSTLGFIQQQSAGGGGDFPEAVHSALNTAIEELDWSESAMARIAFLLLDAPPHYTNEIIEDLQNSISKAAKKGIKIIPVTASGIDKETEFLMRFFSVSTNGTYVFITNDSGIGGEHLEASVGDYEVEYLNDLMIRLIKKYTDY